ncbi:MAG: endonuclease/exonuclease/phosphatase family protein [Planctomycetes bacterium]|nr:endonuclease/exonuclease/phosphatase family protein [Planctomycetota bacterium]
MTDSTDKPPCSLRAALRSRLVVLARLGVLALLVVLLAGGMGRAWWAFDLASHFQTHYLLAAAVLLAACGVLRLPITATGAALALVVTATRVVPWYVPGPDPGPDPGSGPTVRLLIVNVLKSNPDRERVLEYLVGRDADVVILQEVDTAWMEALAPLRESMPHSLEALRYDDFGIAVLSRLPMSRGGEVISLGRAGLPSLACTLERDGAAFTLIATHPVPPVRRSNARLRDGQIDDVATLIENAPRPVVLAGDLNASMWSVPYKDLVARTGLRNARAGFGVLGTWAPRRRGWLGRVPIDHCLHSRDVTIRSCATGPSIGSDHLPLEVELGLPAPK